MEGADADVAAARVTTSAFVNGATGFEDSPVTTLPVALGPPGMAALPRAALLFPVVVGAADLPFAFFTGAAASLSLLVEPELELEPDSELESESELD